MTPPNASRTARERARAELTREIKQEAKRQLAKVGADGLSLRAVARELGMVSSALYRYFASRDDLLTALIIDAYDAIGAAVEEAVDRAVDGAAAEETAGPRERWVAACRAIRSWARAHPHEYALIYGSPVPGYRAPEATIVPAARVPLALAGIVRDAASSGLLADEPPGAAAPGAAPKVAGAAPKAAEKLPEGLLAEQAAIATRALAEAQAALKGGEAGDAIPPAAGVRMVIAWTQLFGMVSFELFGQFANTFDPADELFEYTVARMAGFVLGP